MTTQTMTPASLDADRARLLAVADAAHEQFPQYAGHWDAWVVATAARDIVMHGAVCLRKGEQCLLDPTSFEVGYPRGDTTRKPRTYVTVYLADIYGTGNGCDAHYEADAFTVLG